MKISPAAGCSLASTGNTPAVSRVAGGGWLHIQSASQHYSRAFENDAELFQEGTLFTVQYCQKKYDQCHLEEKYKERFLHFPGGSGSECLTNTSQCRDVLQAGRPHSIKEREEHLQFISSTLCGTSEQIQFI